MNPNEEEEFGLTDSLDTQILMHRDAHFGGKFEFMIDYYTKGGKGVQPDFELERIQTLADTERRTGQNLSPLFLSGVEAEKVASARAAYKSLRDLYETKKKSSHLPALIADLILSEEGRSRETWAIGAISNWKCISRAANSTSPS